MSQTLADELETLAKRRAVKGDTQVALGDFIDRLRRPPTYEELVKIRDNATLSLEGHSEFDAFLVKFKTRKQND